MAGRDKNKGIDIDDLFYVFVRTRKSSGPNPLRIVKLVLLG